MTAEQNCIIMTYTALNKTIVYEHTRIDLFPELEWHTKTIIEIVFLFDLFELINF